MKYFKDIEPVSFDIETTGFNPNKDTIFSYCLGYADGSVSVHRLDSKDKGKNMRILEKFFRDTSKAKVCHNVHFEMNFISRIIDVPEETTWHDTMLMSQILQNNCPSHSLDYLANHLADYPLEQDEVIAKMNKLYKSYQRIPEEYMTQYQIADGERTTLLYHFFIPKIIEEGVEEDYFNEIELVKTTVRMEKVGIRLHEKNVNKLIYTLEDRINEIQVNIYKEFGRFINLNSDKQLANLLYGQLGYTPIKYSEKTGEPRSDKDTILALREEYPNEEIFDLILEQRSCIKGIATAREYKRRQINGIIYPNIGTNEARTGRETSREPNLQNVSNNSSVKNPYHIPLRQCFRAHEDGILLLVDYQAIEMRLIIAEAQDKIMLDILAAGGDVHQEAMECFRGKDYVLNLKKNDKAKFKSLRKIDKNAHFALGYGGSVGTVARASGLPVKEFQKMFNGYKERHPEIVNLMRTKIREVKDKGYVDTPFGRKLYIRNHEAYIGLNYTIQHTAAGILKRAQVKVDRLFKNKYGDELKILLPIHDELIIHCPRKLLKYKRDIITEVSREMVDIPNIKVDLETEWKSTTTTWDKAKEVSLER